MLVEPVLCSCTVGHITVCDSRHDSDILPCTQTSWAQVGSHGKQFSSLCTAHFAPVLCRLPRLQERLQDDAQSSSTRKLGRRDETSSSARARKLERGEDIQIGRSKIEFHNMQVSAFRYLEKVFKKLEGKLNYWH